MGAESVDNIEEIGLQMKTWADWLTLKLPLHFYELLQTLFFSWTFLNFILNVLYFTTMRETTSLQNFKTINHNGR